MQGATRLEDAARTTPLDASPFSLVDALVDGFACRVYAHAPKCLNGLYRRAMSAGDSPFIFHDETELTCRDLFRQSARLATALQSRHAVISGARIGLALTDPVAWVISFVAITSIGATAVLLPVEQPLMQRCAQMARCQVVIGDSSDDSGARVSYAALAGHASEGEADRAFYRREIDPSQDAVIVFSSGSTGHPKGVILTHLALMTGMMNMISGTFSAGGDASSAPTQRTARHRMRPCCLLLSPLSNIAGVSQLLLMLTLGGTLVFCERESPGELARIIERRAVRSISGLSPEGIAQLVVMAPQAHSLAGLSFSGSVPDPGLLRWIQARWPHVALSISYGMTETAGAICSASAELVLRRPFCVGRVPAAVAVRIVDDDGCEVPEGAMGEIQVGGAALLRGYCTQTRARRTEDGWFRTGDIGSIAANRYLSVLGRRDDCVIVNDTPVPCSVVERGLRESVGFSEIAVFKAQDERTAAQEFVIAIAGRPAGFDAASIVQFVRDHTGCDNAPVSVFGLEALPRSAAGKTDRARLIELWAQQQLRG